MKKQSYILTFILLVAWNLPAQIVNIPDSNFKSYLLDIPSINTNGDGEIQVSEAEAVNFDLNIQGSILETLGYGKISDLTGIEAFINLTGLNCFGNLLTTIDVSNNTQLDYLWCSDNQLTTLDTSNNPLLTWIICNNNQITNINISQNPLLETLWCTNNQLTDLDVTQNTLLSNLNFSNNQIINIDLTQNQEIRQLTCANNLLTELDLTNCTTLYGLRCQDNQLTGLDLIANTLLVALWGEGNQIVEIDLSFNTSLREVELENNQLTDLNIQNGNNQIITSFDTTGNSYLTCIFVDDKSYSEENWINIDTTSHFVETQTECDAIGVLEEELFKDISIYPNPSLGIIHIENKSQITNDKFQISVHNILGEQILNYDLLKQEIDIIGFPAGIYLLKIQFNNQILTRKILKL